MGLRVVFVLAFIDARREPLSKRVDRFVNTARTTHKRKSYNHDVVVVREGSDLVVDVC